MSTSIHINLRKHADGQRILMRVETFDTNGKDAIESLVILKADKVHVFVDEALPDPFQQDSQVTVWQDSKQQEASK